jgi:hypothetical protein
MKLNDRSINPPFDGLYFCVSSNHCLLGVCKFENGSWVMMPHESKVSDDHHFYWISYEQDI